jgi:hypothetical protein
MERFVLYWEQADASPHASNATISHLREHIRIRSSRAILLGLQADKNRKRALRALAIAPTLARRRLGVRQIIVRSIRVPRKPAMIQFSAGPTPHFHSWGGETFSVNMQPAA